MKTRVGGIVCGLGVAKFFHEPALNLVSTHGPGTSHTCRVINRTPLGHSFSNKNSLAAKGGRKAVSTTFRRYRRHDGGGVPCYRGPIDASLPRAAYPIDLRLCAV